MMMEVIVGDLCPLSCRTLHGSQTVRKYDNIPSSSFLLLGEATAAPGVKN